MGEALRAARILDPVAHSHALAGFVAGAVVGVVASVAAAAVIGVAVGTLEVATAGLATPLVLGVAATAVEFGANVYVGTKITEWADATGEGIGSEHTAAASGQVAQGSPDVFINGRLAARAGDAETCDAGTIAQGSRSVLFNKRPAARLTDKTSCGGQIVDAAPNVFIGGPTVSVAAIQPEVPEWVRWAAVVAGTLPALGQAARALGPALAEVRAGGLLRAAQVGAKAAGRAMEERGIRAGRAGGRAGGASGDKPPQPFAYSPKKLGQTEPGAVPNTPGLQAEMDAGKLARARTAHGYPDLPADKAATFGDDVRPWNGDSETGPIRRVIGSDRDANGGFWQRDAPRSEADWRGGSAVLNDWNGNGGYVESPTQGLRGWIGSARPQISSDGVSVLPGHGEQIWMPPGSANPGPTMPTPWSTP